jgi:mono/diheme cytochrome c family protein
MAPGMLLIWALWCVALATPAGQAASAQEPATSVSETGARLFRTYCATCHGTTGRGGGPMAEELRRIPPDLTKYTARNAGVFPSERLRLIIDGRGITAHGNRDMPVWGDAFRSAPDGLSPETAQARIDAIVRYLETIQELSADRTRPDGRSSQG